jgi:allophanate hydrolase
MSNAASRARLAVVGAHLRGEPLNGQLTDRDARLVTSTSTAPCYRLFALDTVPPKPGLARVGGDAAGAAIEVEVWELGLAEFGDFVAQVPAPMCIGKVVLADGTDVSGFLCEPYALDGADEITSFGGWRAYRSSVADRS